MKKIFVKSIIIYILVFGILTLYFHLMGKTLDPTFLIGVYVLVTIIFFYAIIRKAKKEIYEVKYNIECYLNDRDADKIEKNLKDIYDRTSFDHIKNSINLNLLNVYADKNDKNKMHEILKAMDEKFLFKESNVVPIIVYNLYKVYEFDLAEDYYNKYLKNNNYDSFISKLVNIIYESKNNEDYNSRLDDLKKIYNDKEFRPHFISATNIIMEYRRK